MRELVQRNHPDVMQDVPELAHDQLLRFLGKFTVGHEGGHWLWDGTRNPHGYGRFAITHTLERYAHRIAYTLLRGPIPHGFELDHGCGRENCVNPWHAEPVVQAVNLARQNQGPRPGEEWTPRGDQPEPTGTEVPF